MKLSTKGRYAVMALAELARHRGEVGEHSPVSLAHIAAGQRISQGQPPRPPSPFHRAKNQPGRSWSRRWRSSTEFEGLKFE